MEQWKRSISSPPGNSRWTGQEFSAQPEQALAQANILFDFTLTETAKAIQTGVKTGLIDLTQPAPHPCALQIRRGLGRVSLSQVAEFQYKLNALVEEFTSLQNEATEVLFAQGQRQKAEQAIRHANQSFDRGTAVAEQEWLQPILSQSS